MKITRSAVQAILGTMNRNGLDPKTTYFELDVSDGKLAVAFTNVRFGKLLQFGELKIIINSTIDETDFLIDFKMIDGRKGLIFTGEENGN